MILRFMDFEIGKFLVSYEFSSTFSESDFVLSFSISSVESVSAILSRRSESRGC